MGKMKLLKESEFSDIHDYYEYYDDVFKEILQKMMNGDKTKIVLKKIKPQMYQQALNEFIRYGKLMRFPTKYVYDWKDLVIRNTVILDVITMFYGHTSYFETEEFNDMVFDDDEDNYVSDWSEAMEYIEEKGYDKVLDEFMPTFSNGHDLISDYGLEPLAKICAKLMETQNPDEIIVLINKALDVSHQRSDLSEIFIEGGESSLDRISGVNENVLKIIREEIIGILIENQLEYRGNHQAPSPNTDGAPMHDLTDIYPDDIYSDKGARRYPHFRDYRDQQAIDIIQSAHNKPDTIIKIYRSIPSDSNPKINNGDWVTIHEDYARQHGKSNLNDDFKIISKNVPAKHLYTEGNNIFEWGYYVN